MAATSAAVTPEPAAPAVATAWLARTAVGLSPLQCCADSTGHSADGSLRNSFHIHTIIARSIISITTCSMIMNNTITHIIITCGALCSAQLQSAAGGRLSELHAAPGSPPPPSGPALHPGVWSALQDHDAGARLKFWLQRIPLRKQLAALWCFSRDSFGDDIAGMVNMAVTTVYKLYGHFVWVVAAERSMSWPCAKTVDRRRE